MNCADILQTCNYGIRLWFYSAGLQNGADWMRQFSVWCLASALAMPVALLAEPLPDLVGLHRSEIEVMPEFADVELVIQMVESFKRRGEVLLQIPSVGSEIGTGRMVYLRVSDGLVVPDLRGRMQEEAEAMLRAAGVGSKATRKRHLGVPSNVVAAQIPEAGTRIDASREIVFLLVSDDPGIEVPDLLGIENFEALKTLTALGLTGRIEPPNFKYDIGSICTGTTLFSSRVTSSEPAPGSFVTPGTQIIVRYETFVVANYPGEACDSRGFPL